MTTRSSIAVFSCALMLAGSVGIASAGERGHFLLSSSAVESIQTDAQGRVAQRVVDVYSADARLTEVRTTTYTYEGRFLVETDQVRTDADGYRLGGHRVNTTRSDAGELLTQRRTFTDANERIVRTEVATWSPDPETGTTLITTVVRGARQEHVETRYSIQTQRKGRLFSSDTSVFDPQGVQTRRHYVEWRNNRVERWDFDAADEVTRRVLEKHRKNDSGQTMAVDATVFDGRNHETGTWEQRFHRDAHGRLLRDVTTWFDAEGQGLRRRTNSRAWDGRPYRGQQPTTRTRWEHWGD